MKITTEIDKKRSLRKHSIEGDIEVLKLKESLEQYYKTDQYDPSMNSLWDLREANFNNVQTQEVNTLAEMVSRLWGKSSNSKSALVVSKDLAFGISRMYEILLSTLNSPKTVAVFKSMDEAKSWLETEIL